MNFELEQWEIPPGADANNLSVPIEFGPIDWNGEQTMISARWLELASGEALAFFRPHCDEINYVVTSDGLLYQRHTRINSKTLGERTRLAIDKKELHCGRLFFCGGEAVITQNSIYHWASSSDSYQRAAPLKFPFDSANKHSAYIYDWLQTRWKDANSEVRFSWEWNRKKERERLAWFGTIVPRWNELHDLMRAASSVAALPVGKRWILTHVDTHNHTPELLERLQPWRELLEAQFSFEPLPESYPQFLRQYFSFISSHVQIEGVESSAHEQLEAKLFLRDWLVRHVPEHLHLVQ